MKELNFNFDSTPTEQSSTVHWVRREETEETRRRKGRKETRKQG